MPWPDPVPPRRWSRAVIARVMLAMAVTPNYFGKLRVNGIQGRRNFLCRSARRKRM